MIFNALTTGNYSAEKREMHNDNYIVVPCVLLVEGVHNGSLGSSFYSGAEIMRSASLWNDVPVLLNHPYKEVTGDNKEIYEVPLFAKHSVEVLDESMLGRVYNVEWDDMKRRLTGELWLEISLMKEVAPEIYKQVMNGEPVEVSTGLATEVLEEKGVWRKEHYDRRLTGFTPDHLAILTEEPGACSYNDGCGIRTLNSSKNGNETQIKINFLKTIDKNKRIRNIKDVFNLQGGKKMPETDNKIKENKEEKELVKSEFTAPTITINNGSTGCTCGAGEKKDNSNKDSDKKESKEGEEVVNKGEVNKVDENAVLSYLKGIGDKDREGLLRTLLPETVINQLNRGAVIYEESRAKLISALSGAQTTYNEDELKGMDYDNLEKLYKLYNEIGEKNKETNSNAPIFLSGFGTGPIPTSNKSKIEPMLNPVFNGYPYKKETKQTQEKEGGRN